VLGHIGQRKIHWCCNHCYPEMPAGEELERFLNL